MNGAALAMFLPDAPHWDTLLRGVVLGPLCLLWVTFIVRLVGLRSFSKMTAFDFISTVATGSLLANAASAVEWRSFAQSCLAVGAILALQALLAWLRRKSDAVKNLLENEPILLMRHGSFIRSAMRKSRVSESDIMAKLRAANVLAISDVDAVVLETTGDISILRGGEIAPALLAGVRSSGVDDAPAISGV